MTQAVGQQIQLPMRKAVQIAWKNLRVRWWRSLLVTSGIILALAFLAYVMCSDALTASVADAINHNASYAQLRETLNKDGVVLKVDETSRAQTRWLVGLALLVSFVGILNAMLMSVTERFAEIGTMKCLGALDSFIIKLFMLESVFQGLSGTLLGILAGVLLAVIEGFVIYGGDTAALLPGGEFLRIVGITLVAGTALTIVGALYPAWRAAKMQPVDAMRTEV